MDHETHQMRLAHWTTIVQDCNNSGLSKMEWLAQNNINEKQFYYWQRRVRNEVFQEITTSQEPKNHTPAFVEVPAAIMQSSTNNPGAVLRVGKCTIELNDSITPQLLNTILQVVTDAQ